MTSLYLLHPSSAARINFIRAESLRAEVEAEATNAEKLIKELLTLFRSGVEGGLVARGIKETAGGFAEAA